ncbi:MAG: hypothetical protein SGILL_009979 [Bacillariaceae sp.]
MIYPYASEDGVAYDTVTPGKGLVFRKDLEHAGSLLTAGEKHILTANILGMRKQSSNQVVFVTFPNKDKQQQSRYKLRSAVAALKQVACQDSSYALPVDCLIGTVLDAHVRFTNRQYESNSEELPPVVTYECTNFTFEQFGTVAKILLRSYVHEDEISKHADAIEFFGPFAAENLLVQLAVESTAVEESKACQKFVQPKVHKLTGVADSGDRKPAAKKSKSEEDTATKEEEDEDLAVIVCENESRTQVVAEVAGALGFSHYVPFKMVFVHGHFLHGNYDRYVDVPVTPVALTVGDFNHVFALQNVGGQGRVTACTIADYHNKYNYFATPDPPGWNGETIRWPESESEEDFEEYGYEYHRQKQEFAESPRGLALKVALGSAQVREQLSEHVLENMSSEGPVWEFTHFEPLSSYSTEPHGTNEKEDQGSPVALFHRDQAGNATFTMQEAEDASKYIASMNLDGRVKSLLQKKRFELRQQVEEGREYYCNESTYTNISVLLVTGLVRLDPSVDPASNSIALPGGRFDVWPTLARRKEARQQGHDMLHRLEIAGMRGVYRYSDISDDSEEDDSCDCEEEDGEAGNEEN